MDWGYADYRWRDYLGVRVGLVKAPLGLYNQGRDTDFLRTPIFLPQSVYNESYREFQTAYYGGEIYGNIELGAMGDMDYEALLGTINFDTSAPLIRDAFVSFASQLGQAGVQATNTAGDMKYALATAIRWNTPIEGLRLGATNINTDITFSGNVGPFNLKTNLTYDYSYVLSAEYAWNNLTLASEYARTKMVTDLSLNGVPMVSGASVSEKYYAQISYRFCDWFEMGTYYSVFYPDVDDKGGDWQKDWTISARFDVLDNMTIKAETHFIDGAANFLGVNNPQGLEDNCVLYAVKCSVNF
jgi:hypothetical protein